MPARRDILYDTGAEEEDMGFLPRRLDPSRSRQTSIGAMSLLDHDRARQT